MASKAKGRQTLESYLLDIVLGSGCAENRNCVGICSFLRQRAIVEYLNPCESMNYIVRSSFCEQASLHALLQKLGPIGE
jgi:hypothetical protein